MPVSQAGDPGAIPGGSTEIHRPVGQRQGRLVHIQETMVRFHPGLLTMPRYAKRQSDSTQTRGFAGSSPPRATRTSCVGWALVSPTVCRAAASSPATSAFKHRRCSSSGRAVYISGHNFVGHFYNHTNTPIQRVGNKTRSTAGVEPMVLQVRFPPVPSEKHIDGAGPCEPRAPAENYSMSWEKAPVEAALVSSLHVPCSQVGRNLAGDSNRRSSPPFSAR